MCVILSAKMSAVEDPSMADKEAVLATLNINAMTFNKVRIYNHAELTMFNVLSTSTITFLWSSGQLRLRERERFMAPRLKLF